MLTDTPLKCRIPPASRRDSYNVTLGLWRLDPDRFADKCHSVTGALADLDGCIGCSRVAALRSSGCGSLNAPNAVLTPSRLTVGTSNFGISNFGISTLGSSTLGSSTPRKVNVLDSFISSSFISLFLFLSICFSGCFRCLGTVLSLKGCVDLQKCYPLALSECSI